MTKEWCGPRITRLRPLRRGTRELKRKEFRKQKSPHPFASLVCFVGRLFPSVDRCADVTVRHQPVVFAMSTNPFPEETVSYKTPYRATSSLVAEASHFADP